MIVSIDKSPVLGDGLFENLAVNTVQTKLSGKTVTKVDTGGSHACALADGSMYCWGNNQYGAIGNGPGPDQRVPLKILDDVSEIAVTGDNDGSRGASFAIIRRAFYSWGMNGYGILADGTANNSNKPTASAFSF